MEPQLPTLKILPLDKLILHEDHDLQRTAPLVERLRAQGVLRNPPIVMPLPDGSGRFMVLDGANRTTSLQEMEFPHIVSQVVNPEDKNVSLQTWNHVVWGMGADRLIAGIREETDLRLEVIERQRSYDAPDSVPVLIRTADGDMYLAYTPDELIARVKALHAIVDCYKERASLDRTSQTLVEGFKSIHPDLTAVVIFPRFEVRDVLELVGAGSVLPTGITRFTVSPRVLHLNFPLHELSSGKPLAYKEAYLEKWVQERVKNKRIRHYAEATFLFDE